MTEFADPARIARSDGEPSAEFVDNASARPLGDPLRTSRRFLPYLFALPFVVLMPYVVWRDSVQSSQPAPWWLMVFSVVIGIVLQLPMLALVLYILPKRVVNAFYLRSFRNDLRSWPIRKAIQASLGRQFRLSGIRDPRERMPVALRLLGFAVFLFRYSTPKRMNLEANDDWQARLWRSLADARRAFIDLLDVTPFVEEEIRLCYERLGLERILFVVDGSRNLDEWRAWVGEKLCLDSTRQNLVQVGRWDESSEGRRAFQDSVRQFATQPPHGTAGYSQSCPPAAPPQALSPEGVKIEVRQLWTDILLGAVLMTVLIWLLITQVPNTGWLAILWVAPLALLAYVAFLTVGYLIDCGSWRDRLIVSSLLALVAGASLVPIVPVIYEVKRVHETAYRVATANKLKQIGLAMHEYASVFGHLPPQAIYHDGKPVLSWRVAILPYLDQGELYSQFHLDEAWDSPHNLALQQRMPDVYAPVSARSGEPYATKYQVFVSRPSAEPSQQALFEAREGRHQRRMDFADRQTIMVIESQKTTPWTKPEDLPFGSGGNDAGPPLDLRALGDTSCDYIPALFADGSVHYLYRSDLGRDQTEAIRSLITPLGGEEVSIAEAYYSD